MTARPGWAVVIAVLITGAADAAEKWADPAMPVGDGLILWVDAGRLPQAWKAHKKPDLLSGAAILLLAIGGALMVRWYGRLI